MSRARAYNNFPRFPVPSYSRVRIAARVRGKKGVRRLPKKFTPVGSSRNPRRGRHLDAPYNRDLPPDLIKFNLLRDGRTPFINSTRACRFAPRFFLFFSSYYFFSPFLPSFEKRRAIVLSGWNGRE